MAIYYHVQFFPMNPYKNDDTSKTLLLKIYKNDTNTAKISKILLTSTIPSIPSRPSFMSNAPF